MGVDQARAIASGSPEVSIREIDAGLVIVRRNQLEKLFISHRPLVARLINIFTTTCPGIIVNMNKRPAARHDIIHDNY